MPEVCYDSTTLGMGNAKSKRKDRRGRTKKNLSSPRGSGDAGVSDEVKGHERYAEDEELKRLRCMIDKHPEIFILNNLMMSVQFFENYDEEIVNIQKPLVSPKETEVNDRLPPQKHVLIPDVLQERIARRVHFTYLEPNLEYTIELLQPIRMYLAFDNIDITQYSSVSLYASPSEAITYHMKLKPSPHHKGYILLQRLDVNPPMGNRNNEDIYSDGDSLYGSKSNRSAASGSTRMDKNGRDLEDEESIYEEHRYGSRGNLFDDTNRNTRDGPENTHSLSTEARRDMRSPTRKDVDLPRGEMRPPYRHPGRAKLLSPINGSPAGSTSSGYRSGNCMDSDNDYGYAQTIYNSPKTSSSVNDGSTLSSYEIPSQCFRRIEYEPDGTIYDPRRQRKRNLTPKEIALRQVMPKKRNSEVWYLNSTKFMKHFCNLFNRQLAEPMGFNPDINNHAQGSVIYCDKAERFEGTMSKIEQYEVVPCVYAEWPDCAQEWLDRPRKSWPHYNDIKKVQEFGCHMIPEEQFSDKPVDEYKNLRWQLIFPAAERFLETCMTHPQVQIYLIALMLHKTYIRPVDSIFGLTVSHIKHRLFWLIEEDSRPSKWAENRTGESLLNLLDSLYRSISQNEPNLPDYFVKDKNLFQEKSHLFRTQKQLNRILENPVMYVFHAMENIRHSRSFFPTLDYKKLLNILTADPTTLVNPALAQSIARPLAKPQMPDDDYGQIEGRNLPFWEVVKQQQNDGRPAHSRKPVTNKNLIEPRKSDEKVVEIQRRCGSLEGHRLPHLLDFFIRHFIKMAERCHEYQALPQKMAYVDQAERLSVLLSEHKSHEDDAKKYLDRLVSLQKRVANSRSRNDPPETPRRNPDRAVFTSRLNSRFQGSEWSEPCIQIPEVGETKEYELESARSSVYNLGAVPRPIIDQSITRAVIHEDHLENSESVELRPTKITDGEDNVTSSERTERVVSLTETQQESYLTETTYI